MLDKNVARRRVEARGRKRSKGSKLFTIFLASCFAWAIVMIFTARANIPSPLGPQHPSMVNNDFLEMIKPDNLGKTGNKSENNKKDGKDITKEGTSAVDDKNDGKDITKATKEISRTVQKEPETGEPNHHMVFSTDCSEYQQWQSYLLFYYAMKNGQPGTVTRIASGCKEEEGKIEIENHEKLIASQMSPQFKLHLTPEFSKVKDSNGNKTGEKYNFFNKPFGILHWLNEQLKSKSISEDDIVILVDPDQIITRPITYDFSNESDHIFVKGKKEWKLKTKVAHGVPFAQKFGFGSNWQKRNIADIAGSDSPALNVLPPEARSHYPAGPPYLATARDFHQIAVKWAEYVPLVYKEHPYLMAEMYAYCIAAAHLNLPHQIMTSLMVSDGSTRRGEGWELVEKIPDDELCKPSVTSGYVLPSVLHFCQRYIIGKVSIESIQIFQSDYFVNIHQLVICFVFQLSQMVQTCLLIDKVVLGKEKNAEGHIYLRKAIAQTASGGFTNL